MDAKQVIVAVLIATGLSGLASISPAPLPKGWLVNGGLGSWFYTTTVDHHYRLSSHGAKLIESNFLTDEKDSFCAISQHINPMKYLGKRLRFSAMVSVKDVKLETSLYIRADTAVALGESFAETGQAVISGTQKWRRHELVIDVPKDAILLSFGIVQIGRGASWIDNLQLEEVGLDTPLTHHTSFGRRIAVDGLPTELVP